MGCARTNGIRYTEGTIGEGYNGANRRHRLSKIVCPNGGRLRLCGWGHLAQTTESGEHRPVAFASSKLTDSQRRWATIEKECYAIIWALQKFKQWIFAVPTVVQTNHNPLTYLTETTPKNSKLMRWQLAIQEFNNVRFEFRAGANNVAADCVSRMVHRDDQRRQ
jgi:hypothetical protein